MNTFLFRIPRSLLHQRIGFATLLCVLSAAPFCAAPICRAQGTPDADRKQAANAAPDVLVLNNGDTLHGKFVSETAGKVSFHSEALGDISVPWDKIKELHTTEPFGVLSSAVKPSRRKRVKQIPMGTVDVADQQVTVHPQNAAPPAPIPVKDAQYIMDEATLNNEIYHQPNFFAGWNGAATAGATLVSATEDQYSFSGGVNMARTVPSASWLDPRDRTTMDFTGSFGKITQPAYTIPATSTVPASTVAAVVTKTAIFHAGAERDQYFSRSFFALAQTAFDHNFSQNLALQQIYGAGIGWTAIKTAKQGFDLKATMQYESQQFLGTPATASNPSPSATSPNMNLVGSTFSANYGLHLKLFTFTQGLEFIPSYNEPRAYSADETNAFAFPTFKNLSFSVGTLDSYLNDTPIAEPPTKPNSFQFTMGLTYAVKSKY